MNLTFGEYIKKMRTESGMTLTQLAAKLNLDTANLSKIENGKRDFDKKRLEKLSDTFNLNLDDLRAEYFSDIIARKVYDNNCSDSILVMAEEKIAYLKQKGE